MKVEFQKLLLLFGLAAAGAGAPALEPPPEEDEEDLHLPWTRVWPLGQRGAPPLAARTVELEGFGAAGCTKGLLACAAGLSNNESPIRRVAGAAISLDLQNMLYLSYLPLL